MNKKNAAPDQRRSRPARVPVCRGRATSSHFPRAVSAIPAPRHLASAGDYGIKGYPMAWIKAGPVEWMGLLAPGNCASSAMKTWGALFASGAIAGAGARHTFG